MQTRILSQSLWTYGLYADSKEYANPPQVSWIQSLSYPFWKIRWYEIAYQNDGTNGSKLILRSIYRNAGFARKRDLKEINYYFL